MSWTRDAESRELYISGLKLMRSGVLIIIMASIIGVVAMGLMFLFILGILIPWFMPGRIEQITEVVTVPIERNITVRSITTTTGIPGATPQIEESLRKIFEKLLAESPHVVVLGVITGVLLLVSLVLSLIGYWARFVPGARRLGRVSGEFGTASTLVWIGYFWGYLILLLVALIGLGVLVYAILTESFIGVLMTSMGVLAGLILSAILVLIGHIGLIILVFKLYEFEKSTLYFIIAILLIIILISRFAGLIPYAGPFILIGTSILSFITWILLYIALGESISRAESQRVPPTPHTTSLIPPSL